MKQWIKKIVILIILAVLLYSLTNNIINYRHRMAYFQEFITEYEKTLQENRKLKTEIVNQKDLYKLEKDVRNKLGRSKPGEVVLVLPKIITKVSPTPTPVTPIYKQWIQLLMP